MVGLRYFISFVICALCILCTIGCESKQTPIDRLEVLAEQMQDGVQYYTEEDWNVSAKELDQIDAEIEQYKSQYTDEELKEIGRLKGICLAQFTKHSIKNIKSDFEDAMKETEGFVKGFVQGLEDKNE